MSAVRRRPMRRTAIRFTLLHSVADGEQRVLFRGKDGEKGRPTKTSDGLGPESLRPRSEIILKHETQSVGLALE